MTDHTTDTKTAVQGQTTVGTTAVVPGVTHEIVPYERAEGPDKAKMEELIGQINLGDSQSVIYFGSHAQEQLTTVSDQMLEGVKNKDLGAAGESLSEMVTTLRGFSAECGSWKIICARRLKTRALDRSSTVMSSVAKYRSCRKRSSVCTRRGVKVCSRTTRPAT